MVLQSDSSESEAGGGHSMDPAPAPQPSDHQPMDHATSHGITSGEGGATTSAGTSQPSCPQRTECTLLHKTQVALTMWEQLKKTASTPSTVLDLQRPLKRLRPEDTADSAESGDEASDGESK